MNFAPPDYLSYINFAAFRSNLKALKKRISFHYSIIPKLMAWKRGPYSVSRMLQGLYFT